MSSLSSAPAIVAAELIKGRAGAGETEGSCWGRQVGGTAASGRPVVPTAATDTWPSSATIAYRYGSGHATAAPTHRHTSTCHFNTA